MMKPRRVSREGELREAVKEKAPRIMAALRKRVPAGPMYRWLRDAIWGGKVYC
jgi:hypothetical protein